MKNIAVVLAGGIGERMKLNIPKQLLKISGKPILEHTVYALQESEYIDEIIVMMKAEYIEQTKEDLKSFSKIVAIEAGGETRNDTSRIALSHIKEDEANVLFHDAVRPFINNAIIKRCLDALETYNAVDTAIPSADTIIKITDDNTIENIPDRSTLRRGQTPQGFKLTTIKEAYRLAQEDNTFVGTDDCGVVLKYLPNEPIAVVDGDESNIKVTHPLDASIADKLFQTNSQLINHLDEEKRADLLKNKVLVVFGSSYGIGAEIVDMASKYNARVHGFSRSGTGTDITNEEHIREALEKVYKEEGAIDYIVNTAGQLTISPIEKLSSSEIEDSIRINYIAPTIIACYAKQYLEKTKGQYLLFTSSSYTRGRSEYSLYSSSKAAIVNFTQAISEEWYKDGIRVNCINPERTATPMRRKAFGDEDPSKLLSATAVAEASIDALLSDMTGQVFEVRIR